MIDTRDDDKNMKANRVVMGLLGTQIVVLSLGLGQPWTDPPSPVCAVSAQYPMLMALFVHLVALVCVAMDSPEGPSEGGSKQTLLIIVILAIIGLALPLPMGLYFYLYDCNWINVVWCTETLFNGVWIVYWYRWIPPTVVESPSVSDDDGISTTV